MEEEIERHRFRAEEVAGGHRGGNGGAGRRRLLAPCLEEEDGSFGWLGGPRGQMPLGRLWAKSQMPSGWRGMDRKRKWAQNGNLGQMLKKNSN
jgi:hypothetical protein